MDGDAVLTAVSVGPDSLTPIEPSLGKRLKLFKAIKKVQCICISYFIIDQLCL